MSESQKHKTLQNLSMILHLFDNLQIEEISLMEISKALKMTPSTVSRMIETLKNEGFFEKNLMTGKYRLGIRFFELGVVYAFNFPLRKIIRPHIEQMAKELNLTASWAILKNSKVIVIDRVQNLSIDSFTYALRLNLPIHSSSIGKVLLAYLPEEEQDRILQSVKITKFTDATVVDPKLIKEGLKIIREMGYATDRGETYKGINCISAPIRDGTGDIIAAINLIDENSPNSPERIFQFEGYLKEKALFISRQLGYRLYE